MEKKKIFKTIKLWEAIAARYNGNEWVAGYDLLNEPGGALGTEQFEVYDRIYKAVRAIDQIVSFKFKQFGNQRTYQLNIIWLGKCCLSISFYDGMILII
ncbi:MAG: cellulase family glycosylhydrolase [Thomasclavelia ramosa]